MFKIEELAGSLIKQGRFREAIPKVMNELCIALYKGVITEDELFNPISGMPAVLAQVCLNPTNLKQVNAFGDKLLSLAIRCGLVEVTTAEEFNKNVKDSREANDA